MVVNLITRTARRKKTSLQDFLSDARVYCPLPPSAGSVTATNNLAYLLARDALHTLAAAARQAPPGLDNHNLFAGAVGTGLQFEDPSRGMMKAAEVSSEASSKVIRHFITANLSMRKGGYAVNCGQVRGGCITLLVRPHEPVS